MVLWKDLHNFSSYWAQFRYDRTYFARSCQDCIYQRKTYISPSWEQCVELKFVKKAGKLKYFQYSINHDLSMYDVILTKYLISPSRKNTFLAWYLVSRYRIVMIWFPVLCQWHIWWQSVGRTRLLVKFIDVAWS